MTTGYLEENPEDWMVRGGGAQFIALEQHYNPFCEIVLQRCLDERWSWGIVAFVDFAVAARSQSLSEASSEAAVRPRIDTHMYILTDDGQTLSRQEYASRDADPRHEENFLEILSRARRNSPEDAGAVLELIQSALVVRVRESELLSAWFGV